MSSAYEQATHQVVPAGRAGDRTIGELMGDVTQDLSTLMRQEVRLAKSELRESTTQAARGVALLAGAAVGAFLTLLFLSIALWWALGAAMGLGGSGVLVAVLWAVVAVVLVVAGRKELTRMRGLPQTVDTVSKIPNALKGNEEENR